MPNYCTKEYDRFSGRPYLVSNKVRLGIPCSKAVATLEWPTDPRMWLGDITHPSWPQTIGVMLATCEHTMINDTQYIIEVTAGDKKSQLRQDPRATSSLSESTDSGATCCFPVQSEEWQHAIDSMVGGTRNYGRGVVSVSISWANRTDVSSMMDRFSLFPQVVDMEDLVMRDDASTLRIRMKPLEMTLTSVGQVSFLSMLEVIDAQGMIIASHFPCVSVIGNTDVRKMFDTIIPDNPGALPFATPTNLVWLSDFTQAPLTIVVPFILPSGEEGFPVISSNCATAKSREEADVSWEHEHVAWVDLNVIFKWFETLGDAQQLELIKYLKS